MPGYNPSLIEKKWQKVWAAGRAFATDAKDTSKPKYYVLDMFPYPSGQGLHVGHPLGYIGTDIVARYRRAKGFNVMHPMGWDAFGLPAEQYAIKNNVHPRETTAKNIGRFREQLKSLGFSYDWEREVDTTDVGYYRWTQWIFLKLYDTWFDPIQSKGRPISELVTEFRAGTRDWKLQLSSPEVENAKGHKWDELDTSDQRRILSGYRLAYESNAAVNWCPALGTVLANEEVVDGKSEVGGFPVERRPMKQWMLRITAYAERLIEGLNHVEWTDSLKEMQRNWIGKSEGAEVEFELADLEVNGAVLKWDGKLKVFTTRPDTLFGATYMVIAPEHELASAAAPAQAAVVKEYQKWAASRSERERQEGAEKTGVWTGLHAVNPVNGKRIPIWVSDYVIMGYGTGAIMAVPAHDERDWEFAKKFKLPIELVVQDPTTTQVPEYVHEIRSRHFGKNGILFHDEKKLDFSSESHRLKYYFGDQTDYSGIEFIEPESPGTSIIFYNSCKLQATYAPMLTLRLDQPYPHNGIAINSPWIEGLPTLEAKSKMIDILEEKGIGKRRVNYKIRDWLFSRQRYWGEPFPVVHLEDGTTVRLGDEALPVELPELADFLPTGTIDPPLSKAKGWVDVHVVVGADHVAKIVPEGTAGAVKGRRELNTMPQWAGSCWYYIRYLDPKNKSAFVDAGIEKYWLKSGVDIYVGGVEHAVLHLLYSRFWHKVLFDWNLVSGDEPFRKLVNQGLMLGEDNQKMSKSRGNVVNPDDVIADYGADALRMFEMFMGPFEQGKPWSTAGVEGSYRFLQRVWRNVFDEEDRVKTRNAKRETRNEVETALHRLIKKVGEDIEKLSFNTSIAAMMEFNNLVGKVGEITTEGAITFVRLLEPFAPHFAEEVYERLGGEGSVSKLAWPAYDAAMLVDSEIELPVQVNGKLRGRIRVANDIDEAGAVAAALADAEVQKFLSGKEPKKKIYVKGRMVNLVI